MSQGFDSVPPNGYYDYSQAGPSSHVRQNAQPLYMNNVRPHATQLGGLPPRPQMGYYPKNAPSVMRPAQPYMSAPAGFQQYPQQQHQQQIHPHTSVQPQYHMVNTYQSPMAGPLFGYQDQHLITPASASEFRFGVPEVYSKNDGWTGEWDDDLVEFRDGQEVVYGNLEVKHRRRTTPEQLKTLEHWFDVNPKPDNSLREWLAQELGMTKRNVQVWFQNRRAKVKGQIIKDKATRNFDDEDTQRLLSAQTTTTRSPPKVPIGPPAAEHATMARRVSLANGEAARIEAWAAKRAAAARKQELHVNSEGYLPPGRPAPMPQGQAAAARRGSIPYPSPIITSVTEEPLPSPTLSAGLQPSLAGPNRRPSIPGNNGISPKISPIPRPTSTALHLTAIRNNSRRASMPGTAAIQLLSSGPFTPPRVVSNTHQVGVARPLTRELSPIKDHDDQQHYPNPNSHPNPKDSYGLGEPAVDFLATYKTPMSTTYAISQNSTTMAPSVSIETSHNSDFDFNILNPDQPDFSPNAPLPSPGFSFGSVASNQSFYQQASNGNGYPSGYGAEDERLYPQNQQAMYRGVRQGRLGSIASINTITTDGGTETGSDYAVDWANVMPGFDPDLRRASAPPDLLHNLGVLGVNNSLNGGVLRPSPLGTGHSSEMARSNLSTSSMGVSPKFPISSDASSVTNPSEGGGPSPSSVNGASMSQIRITSVGPGVGSSVSPVDNTSSGNINHNTHNGGRPHLQHYNSVPIGIASNDWTAAFPPPIQHHQSGDGVTVNTSDLLADMSWINSMGGQNAASSGQRGPSPQHLTAAGEMRRQGSTGRQMGHQHAPLRQPYDVNDQSLLANQVDGDDHHEADDGEDDDFAFLNHLPEGEENQTENPINVFV